MNEYYRHIYFLYDVYLYSSRRTPLDARRVGCVRVVGIGRKSVSRSRIIAFFFFLFFSSLFRYRDTNDNPSLAALLEHARVVAERWVNCLAGSKMDR